MLCRKGYALEDYKKKKKQMEHTLCNNLKNFLLYMILKISWFYGIKKRKKERYLIVLYRHFCVCDTVFIERVFNN